MIVQFTDDGWDEYLSWTPLNARTADAEIRLDILRLIEAACRSPFQGLGKPEPLRARFRGFWFRRTRQEHLLEIAAYRGHL